MSDIFNKIADKLEESKYENEKIKKSVSIKVEAQTQSLKEIISALEQKVQNRTLEVQTMVNDLEECKKSSKAKEVELIEFKNQITNLKTKLEKSSVKKVKILTEDTQKT